MPELDREQPPLAPSTAPSAMRGRVWAVHALRAWFVILAMLTIGSTLVLGLIEVGPRLERLDWLERDGVAHMLGGLLIGLAAGLAAAGNRVSSALVAAFAVSTTAIAAVELAQLTTSTRSPDIGDVLTGALGAAFAALVLLGARGPVRIAVLGTTTSVAVLIVVTITVLIAIDPGRDPVGEPGFEPAPAAALRSTLTNSHDPDAAARAVWVSSPTPSRGGFAGLAQAQDLTCLAAEQAVQSEAPATSTKAPDPGGPVLSYFVSDSMLVATGPLAGADTMLGSLRSRGVDFGEADVTFSSDDGGLATPASVDPLTARWERSGALSIDMSVAAGSLEQSGPKRIVTISNGVSAADVSVHLGQQSDALSLRIRRPCDALWILFHNVFLDTTTRHLAIVFEGRIVSLIFDGIEVARVDLGVVDLALWTSGFPLTIGNELDGSRPWRGTLTGLRFWDRALTVAEIKDLRIP